MGRRYWGRAGQGAADNQVGLIRQEDNAIIPPKYEEIRFSFLLHVFTFLFIIRASGADDDTLPNDISGGGIGMPRPKGSKNRKKLPGR